MKIVSQFWRSFEPLLRNQHMSNAFMSLSHFMMPILFMKGSHFFGTPLETEICNRAIADSSQVQTNRSTHVVPQNSWSDFSMKAIFALVLVETR